MGHLMRYWYDTEFLEDGRTIELISIGIVAEDGREYYAVNSEMPWEAILERDWLVRNVIPSLPIDGRKSLDRYLAHGRNVFPKPSLDYVTLDTKATAMRPRFVIANEVRDFLLAGGDVELWGYYPSYDHVLLAQLWGPMIARPEGIPMWTNDVQQLAYAAGLAESLPEQTGTAHNALDDARWTKAAWEYLTELSAR